MAVFKRKDSPHWFIEFTLHGETVRKSNGTTVKREALDLEEGWRREIRERYKNGKKPPISLAEAAATYYTVNLKPGGEPAKLSRDQFRIGRVRQPLRRHHPPHHHPG